MRSNLLLATFATLTMIGCGVATAEEASSIQPDVPSIGEGPTRLLSPVLPGDDPTFRAALDAYDPTGLERRVSELTGLRLTDVSAGYFGQYYFLSLWAPASDADALRACHELVASANEFDFPATEIEVKAKTYADFDFAESLAVVDSTGTCVLT